MYVKKSWAVILILVGIIGCKKQDGIVQARTERQITLSKLLEVSGTELLPINDLVPAGRDSFLFLSFSNDKEIEHLNLRDMRKWSIDQPSPNFLADSNIFLRSVGTVSHGVFIRTDAHVGI